MRWWFGLLLFSLIGSGCRAPAPAFDPFAPYGNRVIPPPATGSIGSPNGYYPAAPAVAPPPTSQAPTQTTPSLATPPAAPRTSSLPNSGNWESASMGNGVGFVTPGATPPLITAQPWDDPGYPGGGAQVAWGATPAPPVAVNAYPGAQVAYEQPMQQVNPMRPRWNGAAVPAQSIPGDTVYIPQPQAYMAANDPGYYGTLESSPPSGWQRRR